MYKIINESLTNVESGLVIHGTNCSGGFGSGVAGAIKKKWYVVYEKFMETGTGGHLLGTFHPVNVTDSLIVANCYTQLKYGKDGAQYANPNAVYSVIYQAYKYADKNNIDTLSLPQIGCGLGGLSWVDDVEPILIELSEQYPSVLTNVYYIQ